MLVPGIMPSAVGCAKPSGLQISIAQEYGNNKVTLQGTGVLGISVQHSFLRVLCTHICKTAVITQRLPYITFGIGITVFSSISTYIQI